MAYGAKSSDISEVSYLGYGEHGNIRIADISAGLKKRKNSETEDDVCDVVFKNAQGQYQQRMFNPDNDADAARKEKNQEYYSKLMAYILKKLKGKDIEVPSTINNWKELTDWFIKEAGQKAEYSKVLLQLKLVGNVYDGKANVVTTRYFGWLERMDSEKKIKFSANELQSNAEYDRFMADKKPKTEGGDSGGAEDTGDLAF